MQTTQALFAPLMRFAYSAKRRFRFSCFAGMMHSCLIRSTVYVSYSVATRKATRALLRGVPGPVQFTIERHCRRGVGSTFENTAGLRYDVVL